MIQAWDVDPSESWRMADIAKKTKRYPTDLTDAGWVRIELLLPRTTQARPKAKRRSVDLREILNAIRYMARSGGSWRMLPKDFPPWQTVYWWFRRFVRLLLFRTIHDVALMIDRERSARERGLDANKKVVGRKRHIAVDTDGRLLMVNLTTADISDSAGAQVILTAIRKRWPWLKHLFADGAFGAEVAAQARRLATVNAVLQRCGIGKTYLVATLGKT